MQTNIFIDLGQTIVSMKLRLGKKVRYFRSQNHLDRSSGSSLISVSNLVPEQLDLVVDLLFELVAGKALSSVWFVHTSKTTIVATTSRIRLLKRKLS